MQGVRKPSGAYILFRWSLLINSEGGNGWRFQLYKLSYIFRCLFCKAVAQPELLLEKHPLTIKKAMLHRTVSSSLHKLTEGAYEMQVIWAMYKVER
jgi:hypothetical protein